MEMGQVNGIKTELTTYEGFKPIGSKTAFKGIFKGNNNEIKNLYEDKKTLNVLGLFANINSAILQDLTVTGNITNTLSANAYTYEGGIVANATGNSTIKDVNNKVNVSNNFGNGAIAGIIGRCNGEINIENCCNAASINGSQHTGGIVGVTGNTVQIKKCENLGEVKSELRTDTRAGGIIARIYSGETTIINSYNKIQVKGTSMVGGIAGYGTGSINNCSNNGEMSINKIIR